MSNSREIPVQRRIAIAVTPSKSSAWVLAVLALVGLLGRLSAQPVAGPLFSEFRLTLDLGRRIEVGGPLFYSERRDEVTQWALPPLMSLTADEGVDSREFDLLYPLLTYDRFGAEYRFQIFQVFNFAGGRGPNETNKHRFSLFPFYLQQRSADRTENYTSVLPFYGHLKNRFFRDEVFYVMMPIYVQSRKRDVVTDNYVFPFFHLRHGDGLTGWQLWPIVGHEH